MRTARDARGANHAFSIEDRFWAKVSGHDFRDCWEWTAAIKQGSGYGTFHSDGKLKYAHRIAYELMVGPIPEGLQLDHLCGQRACVNPWHLDPVTPIVNSRRGRLCRASDITCANGHPWTKQSNVLRQGHRKCLVCAREALRRHRARLQISIIRPDQVDAA